MINESILVNGSETRLMEAELWYRTMIPFMLEIGSITNPKDLVYLYTQTIRKLLVIGRLEKPMGLCCFTSETISITIVIIMDIMERWPTLWDMVKENVGGMMDNGTRAIGWMIIWTDTGSTFPLFIISMKANSSRIWGMDMGFRYTM